MVNGNRDSPAELWSVLRMIMPELYSTFVVREGKLTSELGSYDFECGTKRS